MRPYTSIAVFTLGVVCSVANVYEGNIATQGLLGSHFGVPGFNKSYDYIIVGGGTAGLTIARRLATDPSNSIAVIEAGDFLEFSNGNLSQIPAFASYFTGNNPTLKNPYLDWYMYTTPQLVSIYFWPLLIHASYLLWILSVFGN